MPLAIQFQIIPYYVEKCKSISGIWVKQRLKVKTLEIFRCILYDKVSEF